MPGTSPPPSSSPPSSPPPSGRPPAPRARQILVVAGGAPPDPRAAGMAVARFADRSGSAGPFVIAADRGFDHAIALGMHVDVLIGDLDSIKPESIEQARANGSRVEQHPADKDATDLELALDLAFDLASGFAVETAAEQIGTAVEVSVLIGTGPDDRLDHLAAQFGLLASPVYAAVRLEAWIGRAHIQVVHGPGSVALDGRPAELVTLLPFGGHAIGVRTAGLRFPLHGETLDPFATRGVSNEVDVPTAAAHSTVTVALERGALLVIRPNALEGNS